jgi:nitrate reductase beta subunit
VFTRVYQTLRDTGTLPGVRIAAERDVNEGVDEEEGIVQMVQSSPRAVREELQDVFVFLTRECAEHCMQRACIHTTFHFNSKNS